MNQIFSVAPLIRMDGLDPLPRIQQRNPISDKQLPYGRHGDSSLTFPLQSFYLLGLICRHQCSKDKRKPNYKWCEHPFYTKQQMILTL